MNSKQRKEKFLKQKARQERTCLNCKYCRDRKDPSGSYLCDLGPKFAYGLIGSEKDAATKGRSCMIYTPK